MFTVFGIDFEYPACTEQKTKVASFSDMKAATNFMNSYLQDPVDWAMFNLETPQGDVWYWDFDGQPNIPGWETGPWIPKHRLNELWDTEGTGRKNY